MCVKNSSQAELLCFPNLPLWYLLVVSVSYCYVTVTLKCSGLKQLSFIVTYKSSGQLYGSVNLGQAWLTLAGLPHVSRVSWKADWVQGVVGVGLLL